MDTPPDHEENTITRNLGMLFALEIDQLTLNNFSDWEASLQDAGICADASWAIDDSHGPPPQSQHN